MIHRAVAGRSTVLEGLWTEGAAWAWESASSAHSARLQRQGRPLAFYCLPARIQAQSREPHVHTTSRSFDKPTRKVLLFPIL